MSRTEPRSHLGSRLDGSDGWKWVWENESVCMNTDSLLIVYFMDARLPFSCPMPHPCLCMYVCMRRWKTWRCSLAYYFADGLYWYEFCISEFGFRNKSSSKTLARDSYTTELKFISKSYNILVNNTDITTNFHWRCNIYQPSLLNLAILLIVTNLISCNLMQANTEWMHKDCEAVSRAW